MAQLRDKGAKVIPHLTLREVESEGVKHLRQLLGRFSQAQESRQRRLELIRVPIPESRTA